jgi:hypothetical protein
MYVSLTIVLAGESLLDNSLLKRGRNPFCLQSRHCGVSLFSCSIVASLIVFRRRTTSVVSRHHGISVQTMGRSANAGMSRNRTAKTGAGTAFAFSPSTSDPSDAGNRNNIRQAKRNAGRPLPLDALGDAHGYAHGRNGRHGRRTDTFACAPSKAATFNADRAVVRTRRFPELDDLHESKDPERMVRPSLAW